ncbi:hypothetical protein TRVA0_017S00650 [Trichomonascus vanleenenianus]|uniref:uncharacterized protein n=1 Tax=Trichomonascus vanleenenianus TaxID=2268995 RepID=UPI003ECB6F0B
MPSVRVRPIDKIAKATAACSVASAAYGQCILANYTAVAPDMCAKEFAEFRRCVQEKLGRKW